MTLERAAWITAVGASWIAAVACFTNGYQGYGWVAIAVGIAASINLFGHSEEG